MTGLWRRWQQEVDDAYVVSLVRAVLGVLLMLNAWRALQELSFAYFGDLFHMPILPAALVPSRQAYHVICVAQLALGCVVVLGRGARPALLASALLGLYVLLCDRVNYHNNRYALFLFAFLLAFAPCDRAFRLPPRAAGRSGPLWAQRLAQLQLAIIYLASSSSKLFDPDWRGGLVMSDRLTRATQLALQRGVPGALMHLLSAPLTASVLAKLAIATELCLALCLFAPRLRAFALWWGTWFHLTIELTSNVELFSWLTLAIYALFAVPRTRERVLLFQPADRAARAIALVVRRLDWLARFELRPDPQLTGPAVAVIDRDGSVAHGFAAFAKLTRALPLLFPACMPLLAAAQLAAHRRGRQ